MTTQVHHTLRTLSLFGIMALACVILFSAQFAFATHESCGNRDGGGGCQNCSCGGGNCNNPPKPPPPPTGKCELTVDPSVAEKGTSQTEVSWEPTASKSGGSLVRWRSPKESVTLTAISPAISSFTDKIGDLNLGKYFYAASYTAPKKVWVPPECFGNNHDGCGSPRNQGRWVTMDVKYSCVAPLVIIPSTAPECSDGIDNKDLEDTLADTDDPGCHTDGDPDNEVTYDPDDDDERDTKPNLVAHITDVPSTLVAGKVATIGAAIDNVSGIPVVKLSDRDVTFKRVGDSKTMTLWHGRGTYRANGTWEQDVRFRLPEAGKYKMCVVADAHNVIAELNESDNSDCAEVTVTESPGDGDEYVDVDLFIRKQGDTAWGSGVTISAGEQVELRMVPNNADSCSVTSGGFSFVKQSNQTQTITTVTEPTSGTKTYSVRCTKGGKDKTDSVSATITGEGGGGDMSFTADPDRVRKGDTSHLTWELGGRTGCTVSGNGESFAVSSDGERDTAPINWEVTYTLACSDDSLRATIKVIPSFQEI